MVTLAVTQEQNFINQFSLYLLMDAYHNGNAFEGKAYAFLMTKFDKVEWLSRDNNSAPYDFLCWRGLKKLFGDAKYRKRGKPALSPSQVDADFVICNNKNKFRIIYRKNFKGKVHIVNNKFIQIPSNTYEALSALREKHEPFSKVIERLIYRYNKSKDDAKYKRFLEHNHLREKSYIQL